MSAELSLIPRMSEKAYATSMNRAYVFDVPTTVNKQQIAAAVTEQYGVKVVDVNVVNVKGKPVRAFRGKRAYPGRAHRTTFKKAYVTLAEGEKIQLFDEEEKEGEKK